MDMKKTLSILGGALCVLIVAVGVTGIRTAWALGWF